VSGPLAGIRVVEMTGAAPSPFACMMLADMLANRVAEVLRVDRAGMAYLVDRGRVVFAGPAAELDGDELTRRYLGVAS